MNTRIGFIGAGRIGGPMVHRLLSAEYDVTVYARRAQVREELTRAGARTVVDPVDVAGADVVIVCLFTDDQVLETIPPVIAGMRRGAVLVSHTTGSPSTVHRLAAAGADHGVVVVDAPFSGTPEAIGRGELTVLLGGSDGAVDPVLAPLRAYASTIHRTGAVGSALAAKLLNNALFAACTQATLTALEAGAELGIDDTALLSVLADSSGGSAAARYIAASERTTADYRDHLSRFLIKDLDAARSAAADLGVDLGRLLEAARLGPMDLDPTRRNT